MGLPSHVVDAIAREHAYRPINGDVLFIGRQSIPLYAIRISPKARPALHGC